jgi:hypothetical protein
MISWWIGFDPSKIQLSSIFGFSILSFILSKSVKLVVLNLCNQGYMLGKRLIAPCIAEDMAKVHWI